jgi:hypothetical protein
MFTETLQPGRVSHAERAVYSTWNACARNIYRRPSSPSGVDDIRHEIRRWNAGDMIRLFVLGLLVAASGAARAQDAPSFSDYPAAAAFHGRNTAPLLVTKDARQFRTMIREGARQPPNFDGHYIAWTWGCGTDCESGAIIDAATGKVVMLPVVAGTPQDVADDDLHFAYRRDSSLFVMNGMIDEKPPMGSHYFVFDGVALKPLKIIPRAERRFDMPADGKPQ